MLHRLFVSFGPSVLKLNPLRVMGYESLLYYGTNSGPWDLWGLYSNSQNMTAATTTTVLSSPENHWLLDLFSIVLKILNLSTHVKFTLLHNFIQIRTTLFLLHHSRHQYFFSFFHIRCSGGHRIYNSYPQIYNDYNLHYNYCIIIIKIIL